MADLTGPVDYTSRDYASISADLIAAVQTALPEWDGGTDPNDFLRILLEGFAFVGDLTNYYVDRVANESLLSTATARQTLINMAEMFGYSPSGPLSGSTNLTFTNSAGTDATIPAHTRITGTYNRLGLPLSVTFETTQDVTVPANSTAQVASSEGATQYGSTSLQSTGDPIGVILYRSDGLTTSDGSLNQAFLITQSPVIEGSTAVWAHPPGSNDGIAFSFVANLVTAGPDDRVYTIARNADDTVQIIFGDGACGYIPPSGYTIRATYRLGLGASGNVPASTLVVVGTTPTGATLPSTVTVTNVSSALGGTDSESNDSIRNNAALTFRTRDRAVSLQDFEDLAVRRAGVEQASAAGSALSNVIVYVTPLNSGVADDEPGYVSLQATAASYAITSNVATITTSATHGFAAGQVVNITSGAVVVVNGTWTIASTPSGTTFTFAVTNADVISTALSSGVAVVVGDETTGFTDLRTTAQAILQEFAPTGTPVSVAGPVYSDMVIKATVYLAPATRQTVGEADVIAALASAFGAQTRGLQETIYTPDVVGVILGVSGVVSAQVMTFARALDFYTAAAASTGYTNYNVDQGALVGAQWEIFRLLSQNTFVTVTGGIPDTA